MADLQARPRLKLKLFLLENKILLTDVRFYLTVKALLA
jgi:hypothetical protein